MPSYELKIDLNALNHLGINLYSNVPAVLSELIANACSGSQPLDERCRCHEAETGSEIVMAFCGLVV